MKLKHPDSDLVVEVEDDNAEPYLSQGWADQSKAKPKSDTSA